MRDILFRGKGNPNYNSGSWFYGFLIFDGEDYQMANYNDTVINTVLSETVGQYTGLTDNKGVKIFEGDVVKCTDTINDIKFIAVVEFGNPNYEYNWGYQLNFISGDKPRLDILCWVDTEESGTYIEVIGNIYDNPELLTNEKEK